MIYAAGLILFLHTVVPHWHQGDFPPDRKEVTSDNASSILDWIQVMFLVDLGEGHMDNFHSFDGPSDTVQDYDFQSDLNLVFSFSESLLYSKPKSQSTAFLYQALHPPSIPIDLPILRGPPSLIG